MEEVVDFFADLHPERTEEPLRDLRSENTSETPPPRPGVQTMDWGEG